MRILVAAAIEAGAPIANAINTVKMAQGFAQNGHEVLICCRAPKTGRLPEERLKSIYGLSGAIAWSQGPRLLGGGWLYALAVAPRIRRFRPQLVYARNYHLPLLSSTMGVPTVAESHAHAGKKPAGFKRLVQAAKRDAFCLLVTISQVLEADYYAAGVPRGKIAVLPDAVDLELFSRPERLPPSPYSGKTPAVVYAGHLYDYKGIPTILEAAARLPGIYFHFLGGLPEDLQRQQTRARELGLENAVFHGLVEHSRVPPYLWHADALLLPPSAKHPSARWTSPVKLGEYLASQTPVIATSIPALRDWLSDEEVLFIAPDDPRALAAGVQKILGNVQLRHGLTAKASAKAWTLSYKARTAAILGHANVTRILDRKHDGTV